MASKWQGEPKRWRLCGKSPGDGLRVTLGRYDTEEEANADREKSAQVGYYRDLRVEPIPQAPTPAPSDPPHKS